MPTIDLGYVVGPQGPQGSTGATGATGATGSPGPNQVTGSTSTTLNGILQGNGSKVSVLPSDSAPTADSNNAIRSGAIFTALNQKSNHNLLPNWLFVGGGSGWGVFPVNTQGKTSYVGSGPTIDGWVSGSSVHTLTVASDYIRWTRTASSNVNPSLVYTFPHGGDLPAGTYTATIIYRGTMRYARIFGFTAGYLEASETWTMKSFVVTNPARANFQIQDMSVANNTDDTNRYIDVMAVKLESGSQQTLAHLVNGVWVINDVPDYVAAYLACQTNASVTDVNANKIPAFAEMLAPVERGTTASQAYTTGKVFVWKGYLYKAKTSISSGVAFTEGTNCERTTLAAMLSL